MTAPRPTTTRVHFDEVYGHITISTDSTLRPTVTLVETGDLLKLWAYESVDLDEQTARDYAAALVRWADRRQTIRSAALTPEVRPAAEPVPTLPEDQQLDLLDPGCEVFA